MNLTSITTGKEAGHLICNESDPLTCEGNQKMTLGNKETDFSLIRLDQAGLRLFQVPAFLQARLSTAKCPAKYL